MRFILSFTLLLSSLSSMACETEVMDYFLSQRPEHEHHHVIETLSPVAGSTELELYGTKIKLPQNVEVDVYLAASEYYSGYGVDAVVVERQTCEVLDFQNVYSE